MPREIELAEHHRHTERPHDAHPDHHQRDRADHPADEDEDEDEGCQERLRDEERAAQPDPVGDGPDQQRSDRAGEQHQEQQPAAALFV